MMIAAQLSLDLFPASGLDNSLFTAVLLGLLCLFLLNESFGWVFTGLVVPGYLASVFVIQPQAGVVIAAEAVVTYLVARVISDWAAPVMPWNRFFGRERFFLILVCSVAVRLLFEAALLPALGSAAADRHWIAPSVVANLFSIGLIVVPLTANMMWKTGLVRGLPQIVLPTAAVFVALRFVLIPFTNLSISDFELSYENIALGFVASPKTYIILLVGAYLAARNNIAWGWDSNGIVVLALVALAWLSPLKVLTTVVEVMVLVVAVQLVKKLPLLRTANLEGARRLVLVFGIGYALKFMACHLLGVEYPGLKATDYFGFGYLLPSLLALKILQKGNAAVILMPTLQTSLVALVIGSAVGLGLALLQPAEVEPWLTARAGDEVGGISRTTVEEAHRCLGRVKTELTTRLPGDRQRSSQLVYRRLVHDLVVSRDQPWPERRAQAESLGLVLERFTDPETLEDFLVLREPDGDLGGLVGWGLLVVRAEPVSPLVVEVPHPLAEPSSVVCAAALFRDLEAAALLVSGVDTVGRPVAVMHGSERTADLPLGAARCALSGQPVLEIRAPDRGGRSVLWASQRLPSSVDLLVVRERVGEVELSFADPPGARGGTRGRIRLDLSREGARSGLVSVYQRSPGRVRERFSRTGLCALAGEPWFVEALSAGTYRSPRETDLLFLERAVLHPLLEQTVQVRDDDGLRAYLDHAASLEGLTLERITLGDGEQLLWLHEELPVQRGWGAVLIRPDAATERFLAVPDPFGERHSLDLALHLSRVLEAGLIVVSGSGPGDTADCTGDVTAEGNHGTLFDAVHRLALRPAEGGLRPSGLQVRGFGHGRSIEPDLVLSVGVVTENLTATSPEVEQMRGRMGRAGLPCDLWDGSRSLAELRGYGIPQLKRARDLDGQPYGVLWASAGLRRRVAPAEGRQLTRAAERAGMRVEEVWLDVFVDEQLPAASTPMAGALQPSPGQLGPSWTPVLELAAAALRTGDPRYLGDVKQACDRGGIEVRWLVDLESGLPVMWLADGDDVVAINPLAPSTSWVGEVSDLTAALHTGLVPLVVVSGGGV